MTFLEAAMEVLRGRGEAMSAKEIAGEAIARGFISTSGKTPNATMAATIFVDIDRKGSDSQFVKQERNQVRVRAPGIRPQGIGD